MKTIRIGSRESKLAVIQSQMVIDAIHTYDPEILVELVTMKTTGDKILDRTLAQIGGKGPFVKELDAALLDGRVDLTVHSSKDLPMQTHPELPLAAFSRRADPRDVLVLPKGVQELDLSKPIGCSSLRRQIQLRRLFPQAQLAPIRGNVLTYCGYRTQLLEFVDFAASPKNILIRAVRGQVSIKKKQQAKEEIERLCEEFSIDQTLAGLLVKKDDVKDK